MIISRESRKSRKIIHRYRSYVAVRMANASEMMRFRVICEIRVRQKAAWNGNIFIMRFPWFYGFTAHYLREDKLFSSRG